MFKKVSFKSMSDFKWGHFLIVSLYHEYINLYINQLKYSALPGLDRVEDLVLRGVRIIYILS